MAGVQPADSMTAAARIILPDLVDPSFATARASFRRLLAAAALRPACRPERGVGSRGYGQPGPAWRIGSEPARRDALGIYTGPANNSVYPSISERARAAGGFWPRSPSGR